MLRLPGEVGEAIGTIAVFYKDTGKMSNWRCSNVYSLGSPVKILRAIALSDTEHSSTGN